MRLLPSQCTACLRLLNPLQSHVPVALCGAVREEALVAAGSATPAAPYSSRCIDIGPTGLSELGEEEKRATQDSVGNGRYAWATVRAALKKSICHQRIKTHEHTKALE